MDDGWSRKAEGNWPKRLNLGLPQRGCPFVERRALSPSIHPSNRSTSQSSTKLLIARLHLARGFQRALLVEVSSAVHVCPLAIWIWVFSHFFTFSLCHNIRATHAPLHSNSEAVVAFYRDALPLSFFRPEYGDGEVGGGRGRDFNGGRRARARASASERSSLSRLTQI